MKCLLTVYSVLILNTLTFGQAASDDIDRLRQFLNIPQLTRIRMSTSERLTRGNRPLRLFVATGSDVRARAKYGRHIKRWNKSSDSKKYGKLEVVDDLFSADVALVKQSFPNQARTQSIPVVSSTPAYDPVTRSTANRTTTRNDSIRIVPFQIHILRRTDEAIEIVRAITSVEVFRANEKDGTGDPLWDQFRELMIAK